MITQGSHVRSVLGWFIPCRWIKRWYAHFMSHFSTFSHCHMINLGWYLIGLCSVYLVFFQIFTDIRSNSTYQMQLLFSFFFFFFLVVGLENDEYGCCNTATFLWCVGSSLIICRRSRWKRVLSCTCYWRKWLNFLSVNICSSSGVGFPVGQLFQLAINIFMIFLIICSAIIKCSHFEIYEAYLFYDWLNYASYIVP